MDCVEIKSSIDLTQHTRITWTQLEPWQTQTQMWWTFENFVLVDRQSHHKISKKEGYVLHIISEIQRKKSSSLLHDNGILRVKWAHGAQRNGHLDADFLHYWFIQQIPITYTWSVITIIYLSPIWCYLANVLYVKIFFNCCSWRHKNSPWCTCRLG